MVNPWMVMGDFNAILGMHENKRLAPINISCTNFQNNVHVCNLLEFNIKCTFFTWVRKLNV